MQTPVKELKQIGTVQMSSFKQKLRWITQPTEYLTAAAEEVSPDIFRSAVTGYEDYLTIVAHPEAIKQILGNESKKFSAPGEINQLLTPLLGHKSLLNLGGDRHKQERKLIMPSFHGDRMFYYGQKIIDITKKQLQKFPVGEIFNAQVLSQQVTVRLILQIIFGMESGERCEQIIRATGNILDRFSSPFTAAMLYFPNLQKDWGTWSPWGSFLQLREHLDNLIYAEIGDRRQNFNPDNEDILSLMIAAKDESGRQMSDEELRDELMLLIFAGHDTTALAMAWGMYWISANSEVEEKLKLEIATLGENPDPMDIFRLPYLTAVCQEVLRINPVGMFAFPRRADKDVDVLGYKIPKGDYILCCIYLLHQNEELYPNHRKFDPERFLNKQFSSYEFMPFGGGSRRCIGSALAMYELKLCLATLLTSADFTLINQSEPEAKRRGVVLAPKGGVSLQLNQLY